MVPTILLTILWLKIEEGRIGTIGTICTISRTNTIYFAVAARRKRSGERHCLRSVYRSVATPSRTAQRDETESAAFSSL